MKGLGDRLKSERIRIKRTQSELAAIGGVRANAQLHYEQGRRQPSAVYFAAIARCGIDISYILLGVAAEHYQGMNADEALLIHRIRTLAASDQKAFMRVIRSVARSTWSASRPPSAADHKPG